MIADSVAAIGTSHFCDRLSDFLRSHIHFDRIAIDGCYQNLPPVPLYDNCPPEERPLYTDSYLRAAYLLDPIYQLCTDLTEPCVYLLNDHAPDDFRQTAYYDQYYGNIGMVDTAGFLCPLASGHVIAIDLERLTGQPAFSKANRHKMKELLGLVSAFVQQHWSLADPRTELQPGATAQTSGLYITLDQAFRTFGSSVLTPREQEIAKLILLGYSNKALAARLGITPGTVKNHRKALYRKLDISTHAELFSLFLMALSAAPVGSTDDPLVKLGDTKEIAAPKDGD